MPVAHLLGFGDKNLIKLGDRLPKILPHNMCMIGIRSYEEGEQVCRYSFKVRSHVGLSMTRGGTGSLRR